MTTVRIDPRFNGPATTANGGYACGVVAELVGGPARVQLRAPPPLGEDLEVARSEGEVRLTRAGAVVAVGWPGGPQLVAPPAPSLEAATEATRHYPGFHGHPFPTCFVCGPARPVGDGLRIFPGPAGAVTTAPWTPDASVCDRGVATLPVVWAALDCPSYFGAVLGGALVPAVLAELAATVADRPREGEPCVVVAWPLGREGRKLRGGSALYGRDQRLLAVGEALWITLRG